MATVFRPPLVTRVARPLHTQAAIDAEGSVWSNRLLNLLRSQDRFFGAAGQPPTQGDWPVPKGRPHPSDLRTFLDPLRLNLLGKDRFFGLAGNPTWDWPVPKGATPASELRTFLGALKVHLIGQDRFFGPDGQPPTYAWANPPGTVFSRDLRRWDQNLLETTLGILLPFPFALLDWPNPLSRMGDKELRTWLQNLLEGTFSAPAGTPFFLMAWPNPQAHRRVVDLLTSLNQMIGEPSPLIAHRPGGRKGPRRGTRTTTT